MARLIGGLYRWLFSEWRLPLFWLAATALVVRVADLWLDNPEKDNSVEGPSLSDLWDPQWWGDNWWRVLSVYALFALVWWAWQTRKRVVIEEFVDHANQQPDPAAGEAVAQPGPSAKGLSTLLAVELARLHDLYRVVEDQRANPWAIGNNKESKAATFTVEDDSQLLKSAVSTESRFSIGPLAIPVGPLLNVAGRLVQGPRITGNVHKEGDRLILTAQRTGKGRSYSWRVDRPGTAGADGLRPGLDGMIAELAYRMFTDLAERGSNNWRAVRAFSDGLREYRDCLHTPKDRKLKLKQAERKFSEALAEDNDFDLVYYNLGLVYTELKQDEAAKAAYRQALARNPERWEAYYALGRVHHYENKGKEHGSVVRLCERVVLIEPDHRDSANAYNLKGLALKASAREERSSLDPAIESFERAVDRSWRALCAAERRKRTSDKTEQDAVRRPGELASCCLFNLAEAYREKADDSKGAEQERLYRRAEALVDQALHLTRSDARLYHERGKIHCGQGRYAQAVQDPEAATRRYAQAVQDLQAATRIDPKEAAYWAELASAHAADYEARGNGASKQAAARACEQALATVDHDAEDAEEALKAEVTLETTAEAYERIGRQDRGEHVRAMKVLVTKTRSILEEAKQDGNNGETVISGLEEEFAHYDEEEDQDWEGARVSFALGRLYLGARKPKEAEKYLQKALWKLEKKYPQEIARLGLRAMLTAALRAQETPLVLQKYDGVVQEQYGRGVQKKYGRALQEAEGALGLDPFNPSRHEELGGVYSDFEALEDALAAWEVALLWNPSDPLVCTEIGRSHYRLMRDCRNGDDRKAASLRAIEYLERALGLYGSDQLEKRGETHYLLGRLRSDSGDFTSAISQLRVAHALGFAPWITGLFLAESYQKNNASNECTEQYRRLIEDIERWLRESGGGPGNEIVGVGFGDPMSCHEILARAYRGLSFEYAQRDVKLEVALKLLETAEFHAGKLRDEATRDRCLADCVNCEGWILFKLDRIDEAIARLEDAVALNADAEKHLHLAQAHERKAQESEDKDRARSLTRARTHHRHVLNTDTQKEYSQDADDLLKRLDKYEAVTGE